MANKSIEDAIIAINPDAVFRNSTPNDTSGITWIAGTAPIAAETLEAKKAELQAAEDAKSDRVKAEEKLIALGLTQAEVDTIFA